MPVAFNVRLQRRIYLALPLHLQTVGDFHFFCFNACGLFFLILLTPWLLWLGLTPIAWATGWSALSCVLIGWARLKGAALPLVSQLYQSTLLAVVLYAAWHMGGLSSPAMVWLGIVPLLPWFTMSRRWTFIWLSIAFCSVCAFWIFHRLGWLAPKATFTDTDLLVAATMYGLLCLTQGILIVTMDTAEADKVRAMEETAQQLSDANARMIEASQHKDQFLAMVSHAMRTPLNGVKGYLSLLADRPELKPDAREEVEGAQNAASHLLTVINDLLDLSQISQGRFSLSPQVIDLRHGVRDIFRTLESHARGLDLTYRLQIDDDVPTWVKTDPDRLAQILINLLGNAIKFTSQGEVTLRVSANRQGAGQAELSFAVQDSGSGIEERHLARIFDPFYQAHPTSLRPQDDSLRGNGLGLAISKGLAQAMGGELEVSSRLGQGSCFTLRVTMPLAQAAAAPSPQALGTAPEAADPHPYRILLVDDQAVNRAVLAATLQKALPNAQLTQADGGVSALAFLHEHDFDLVLIDLVMPDLDGIEVVRRTRHFQIESRRNVPFIALTANVAPQAVADCLNVGMAEVMPKPFNRQGLLRAIQTHVRGTPSAPPVDKT